MVHQCLSAKQQDGGAPREAGLNMATAAVLAASLGPQEECVQNGEGLGIMVQTVPHT